MVTTRINTKILCITDPLMERIGKRLVANFSIEPAMVLGQRGYDFFIKKSVLHQHQIVQDKMLPHPEMWVKGFLTEPKRRAIQKVAVDIIARSLKITIAPIPENEMLAVTIRKWLEQSVERTTKRQGLKSKSSKGSGSWWKSLRRRQRSPMVISKYTPHCSPPI